MIFPFYIRMVIYLDKVQTVVLDAINSGRKINISDKTTVKCRLRTLCTLWNFAIDQGFADIEKVDIATELLRTLTKVNE